MAVKFLNGIDVEGSLNLHSDDIPDLNARKITAGALDGARLPWNDNDGFSGTYPIVWTATDGLYRSTWLQVRGSDDTLLTRNITADGNVIANNLNIANWDVAYGWGNHASAGYVTSSGNTIIGTDTDIDTSGATIIDNLYMTDGVITSHGTRNLTTSDIGAAATSHKYHSFSNGDEFYDSYGQGNYLRMFTETATFDTFRFRSYSRVEVYDGNSWQPSDMNLDSLLDGREDTGISLLPENSHFRFEINRASGWPTTALFVLQSSWTDTNGYTCSITLETLNGSTWEVKDTWTYSNFQRGLNLHTTTQTHDGRANMRVTINMSWDAASHNYHALTRIMFLSNFSGGETLDPWTWNYNKVVNFDALPQSGGANLATQSWVGSQGYLTAVPSTYATTSYVDTAVANVVSSAPGALDTLNELAAALGDDENFSTTVANNISAVGTRIDEEVLPLIPTDNSSLTNGAGYLTSVPSEYLTQTEGDDRYLQSLPAHNHDRIVEKSLISYGSGFLQWTDHSGNGGNGLNGEAPGNPFNDWHHHIIQNHSNGGGYYVDIASSFHSDRIHFRRLTNGVMSSWREFYHTGNFTDNSSNWDAAHGWGDHGSEGYLTGITSSQVTTALGYTPYEEGTTLSVGTGEINGTNFNIKGVNQIEINDPGEGIVWTSGSSGNITLATVDDTSDNILNLTGTNASFAINGATVATQTYADNAAGAVSTALSEEIGNLSTAVSANTTEASNNRTAITNLGTSKQDAGNYFTDGDTVLNMANNDGLVYDDTTNRMYVKLDGTNREIYHEGNFTPSNYLSLSGGTATGTIAAPTFDATTEVTVGPWAIRHNADNGRLEFVLS